MKDSESSIVVRSSKKTNGSRTTTPSPKTKLLSDRSHKSNGTSRSKTTNRNRARKAIKNIKNMGSSNSKTSSSATKTSKSSMVVAKKISPRKGSKQSPELRPRRRASQTYFFKYQLAKNPLKAEEEDLKLALLASLQQCNGKPPDNTKSKNGDVSNFRLITALNNNNHNNNNNNSSKYHHHQPQSNNNNETVHSNATDPKKSSSVGRPAKTKLESLLLHNHHTSSSNNNHTNNKSDASNHNHHQYNKKTEGKFFSSKKGLQSKFCANSASDNNNNISSNIDYSNNVNNKTIRGTNDSNSPKLRESKKYKPETEDFLTFICFRTTAPNYVTSDAYVDGNDDSNCTIISNTGNSNNIFINNNNNDGIRMIDNKHIYNSNNNNNNNIYDDSDNLKTTRQQNNCSVWNKLTNINGSPTEPYSPNYNRRPIRQSPRFASFNKKISENNDSSNPYSMGTSNAAYDNSNTYEEDMKRASIALEDMAQEINCSDVKNNEVAQIYTDCISKSSSSSFKNNKHLVKGLMTREFAGAFADEETIFESLSNHKL